MKVLTALAVFVLALSACVGGAPEPEQPDYAPSTMAALAPLMIDAPSDGTTFLAATVTVMGRGPANAEIVRDISMAPDQRSRIDANGAWRMTVDLDEGANTLTFRVGDDEATAVNITLILDLSSKSPEAVPTPTPTPKPTPTPSPTPIEVIDDEPLVVSLDERTPFAGNTGLYTWVFVTFPEDNLTLRWNADARSNKNCRVSWRVEPDSGEDLHASIRVLAGETESGRRRIETPFSDASFVVTSSCPTWRMSMQGYEPPPPPTKAPAGGGSCHPSYEGACLRRDASDYDCAGGSGNGPYYVVGPIRVVGYDEFDLDRDNDGVGCE